jgi:hypothetical protein
LNLDSCLKPPPSYKISSLPWLTGDIKDSLSKSQLHCGCILQQNVQKTLNFLASVALSQNTEHLIFKENSILFPASLV